MKKTLLGLAIVAALTIISCKQETKDKVGEATDAIGTEMDQAVDTAAVKVDAAIDSTKSKISTKMKEGAAKMDQKADQMKEEAKK
jgi:cell division protein ZapA (FtsZ GTPase activity inhibitor)